MRKLRIIAHIYSTQTPSITRPHTAPAVTVIIEAIVIVVIATVIPEPRRPIIGVSTAMPIMPVSPSISVAVSCSIWMAEPRAISCREDGARCRTNYSATMGLDTAMSKSSTAHYPGHTSTRATPTCAAAHYPGHTSPRASPTAAHYSGCTAAWATPTGAAADYSWTPSTGAAVATPTKTAATH
jgi:hypothetical protein